MTSAVLAEGDSSLSLSWQGDGAGDFLVSIDVRAEGFAGHADGCVTSTDWQRFVTDLKRLEEKRQGAARLVSAAEEEFEVEIAAIDSLGHLGASGILTYRATGVERWPRQRLNFAFAFDPSKLERFANSVAAAQQSGAGDARSARA